MLKLGKKLEYGLIALMHMAQEPLGAPVSSREIAAEHELPPDLLGKVLQALNRSHLVRSVQGAHGGYSLARPLAEITIGDVAEAVEGPIHLTACSAPDSHCPQEKHCNIQRPLFEIQAALTLMVYRVSLATFQERAQPGASPVATLAELEATDAT